MKWFTSDWHLGEDRLGLEEGKPNLFYRPFKTVYVQDLTIIDKFYKSGFEDGDELWHLGDVLYARFPKYLEWIRDQFPKSKWNLIVGNYDEDKLDLLGKYFDTIQDFYLMERTPDEEYWYLNHYPIKCKKALENYPPLNTNLKFAITGHIHSLWKVQKGMVNVGVDAWHFRPVSEKEIEFCMVACQKYYDENVFPY